MFSMLAWFGALLRNGSYEDLCECHAKHLRFLNPGYVKEFREYVELVAEIRLNALLQFMFSIDHENKIIKTSYREIRASIGLFDITDGRLNRVVLSLAREKYEIKLVHVGSENNDTFVTFKAKEL